jgi:hypothetical protein
MYTQSAPAPEASTRRKASGCATLVGWFFFFVLHFSEIEARGVNGPTVLVPYGAFKDSRGRPRTAFLF